MSTSTRFFPNPYNAYCDVYACRNKAAYFIGRPDATKAATYKLCKECVTAALTNLDDELGQMVTADSTDREFTSFPEPEQQAGTEERTVSAMPIKMKNTSVAQEQAQNAGPELSNDLPEKEMVASTKGTEPHQQNEVQEKIDEKKEQLEQAEEPQKIEQLKHEVESMERTEEQPLAQINEEKQGHGMEESQIQPTLIEQLNNKTVEELKALAKDIGVKGYSKMKKEELVTVLAEGESMNE